MPSFVDEAASLLTPDLLHEAAGIFGVSADGAEKAFSAAIPAVLGTMAGRTDDTALLGEIFQLVTRAGIAGEPAAAAGAVMESLNAHGESPLLVMGRHVVTTLFGGSSDAVAGIIGRLAGVSESGTGILGSAAALALSLLASRVRAGGLDSVGLGRALEAERVELARATPGSIAGLLRISDFAGTSSGAQRAIPSPTPRSITAPRAPIAPRPSLSTLPLVVGLIIGLAVLAWFYLQRQPLR